MQRRKEKEVKR